MWLFKSDSEFDSELNPSSLNSLPLKEPKLKTPNAIIYINLSDYKNYNADIYEFFDLIGFKYQNITSTKNYTNPFWRRYEGYAKCFIPECFIPEKDGPDQSEEKEDNNIPGFQLNLIISKGAVLDIQLKKLSGSMEKSMLGAYFRVDSYDRDMFKIRSSRYSYYFSDIDKFIKNCKCIEGMYTEGGGSVMWADIVYDHNLQRIVKNRLGIETLNLERG